MNRFLVPTAAFAAALLLLASCGGSSDDPTPTPQCAVPADCGADTACRLRTCVSGVCGTSDVAAGTVVATQTAGDCQEDQCDGSGGVVSVAKDTDLPDDGIACTADTCSGGAPGHSPVAADTACSQDAGTVCDGLGACVACNAASQCPGSDTECRTRTCVAHACDVVYEPATFVVSAQTSGDCQENRCNGSGGVTSVPKDADLPDDANACTTDSCSGGAPVHAPAAPDTSCSQGGGSVCDGAGVCVACNDATQCPGTDTVCRWRTCLSHACGSANAANGTLVSLAPAGDCHANVCDAGSVVSVVNDADVPVDGNSCTSDACSGGTPTNPNLAVGSTCPGGTCDGAGMCVVPAGVAAVSPADGASATAPTDVTITFTVPMNPATLTAQTAAGACSGSLQVSKDGFVSCVALASAAPVMSAGDTVATLTPRPGLLVNRTYKVRVTTSAASAAGGALAATYTMPAGFTTLTSEVCAPQIVISQVYGGGGNAGSPYKQDFVELHNRGMTAVDVSGWSLQHQPSNDYFGTWAAAIHVLPAGSVIQPGGFFLVAEALGTAGTADLPDPDAAGTLALGSTAGKVVLVTTSDRVTATCPMVGSVTGGGVVVDFAAYGSGVCVYATGATTDATGVIRHASGCAATGYTWTDFAVAAPAPRNSASAPVACSCTVLNESGAPAEADYCNVQSQSISFRTGVTGPTVYGEILEAGVTEAAGKSASIVAQVGFGPSTANPQTDAGWMWIHGAYAWQSGNNDKYDNSFYGPAPGDYRFAFRFTRDYGLSWTYCDANGAGSNAGLTFDLENLPVMTVTP